MTPSGWGASPCPRSGLEVGEAPEELSLIAAAPCLPPRLVGLTWRVGHKPD